MARTDAQPFMKCCCAGGILKTSRAGKMGEGKKMPYLVSRIDLNQPPIGPEETDAWLETLKNSDLGVTLDVPKSDVAVEATPMPEATPVPEPQATQEATPVPEPTLVAEPTPPEPTPVPEITPEQAAANVIVRRLLTLFKPCKLDRIEAACIIKSYHERRQNIPGAPTIFEISERDVRPILGINQFSLERDKTYHEFCDNNFVSPLFEEDWNRRLGRAIGGIYRSRSLRPRNFVGEYVKMRAKIPGAPPPGHLEPEDLLAFFYCQTFDAKRDTDFATYSKRLQEEDEKQLRSQDPFSIAHWLGKTDCPSMFAEDTGDWSKNGQEALAAALVDAAPQTGGMFASRLNTSPVCEREIMALLVESTTNFQDIICFDMGEVTNLAEEFCRAKSVCFLAGFGLPYFRRIAAELARSDSREDYWNWVAECTQVELVNTILEAHWLTGYPLALLRVPFNVVHAIVESELNAPPPPPKRGRKKKHADTNDGPRKIVPRWYSALLLLHIIKHATVHLNLDDKQPFVYLAYNGEAQLVPLKTEGLNQSIEAKTNEALKKAIIQNLKINI